MSDPSSEAAAAGGSSSNVSDEIGRSIGSIWQRRDGSRPASVMTEYRGDVVTCVIEPGEPDAEPDAVVERQSTDSNSYRLEAQAAVARLTRRSVAGFVAKADSATGVATHKFILERIRVKY